MKFLVTGYKGMLGEYLMEECARDRNEVVGIDIEEADITDLHSISTAIARIRPDVIIHAAAMTDVDGCERDPERAFSINAVGTHNVAVGANEANSIMVYISTDYVFDGTKEEAYTEEDSPGPINIYGRTKLAGEDFVRNSLAEHYIVRIAWLFGKPGRDFPSWLVEKVRKGERPRIFSDQYGSPTYALDVSRKIPKLVGTRQFGIYHLTNSGGCSRFQQAKATLEAAGLDPGAVKPVSLKRFSFPASRPRRTVMASRNVSLLGTNSLRPWDEAIREYSRLL